jgi:hypothetical protein
VSSIESDGYGCEQSGIKAEMDFRQPVPKALHCSFTSNFLGVPTTRRRKYRNINKREEEEGENEWIEKGGQKWWKEWKTVFGENTGT